jgi:hypothetical protein
MSIRLFFEISKDFFNAMYSHFEEEEYMDDEEETIKEKQQQDGEQQDGEQQDGEQQDEEKGWYQYEDDDNPCYCNGCNIYRQIILFIHPNIGDNKFD